MNEQKYNEISLKLNNLVDKSPENVRNFLSNDVIINKDNRELFVSVLLAYYDYTNGKTEYNFLEDYYQGVIDNLFEEEIIKGMEEKIVNNELLFNHIKKICKKEIIDNLNQFVKKNINEKENFKEQNIVAPGLFDKIATCSKEIFLRIKNSVNNITYSDSDYEIKSKEM